VVQFIHFRYLSYLAIGGGVISIFLLFFTLFGGQNINNGARWISIGGISFQPSELNKLCLIIYATAFTANAQKPDGTTRKISFLVLAPTFLSFGIIATQNLSTALMLVVSVFSILFIGNVPWRNFLKSLAYFSIGAVALLGAFWLYWGPNSTMTQRFTTWGSRLETRDERPKDPRDFVITDKNALYTLFDVIAPALDPERQGGYTRLTRVGNRKGDNAPLMQIEFCMEAVEKKAVVKSAEKTAEKAAAAEVAAEAEEAAEAASERAEEAREDGDLAMANEAEEVAAEAGKAADAAEQAADEK